MISINFLRRSGIGKKRLLFLSLAMSCFSYTVHAATYYSRVATGNFNTAGSWSVNPSGTPTNATAITNADIFIIQNGHNITVAASRIVAQITVDAGGTLTLGANTLTVSGNWTNNGTITGSTGRITSTTGTLTNNSVITFSGAGGIIKTTGVLTNSASGTISVTGAGVIVLGSGNFVNNNTSPTAVNFGSSQISLTGSVAGQTVGGFSTTGVFATSRSTGNYITLTGSVRCSSMSITGSEHLSLGTGNNHIASAALAVSGGTGKLHGGSSTLTIYGGGTSAMIGTGTNFIPATSTIVFAGTTQTVAASGTKNFYNLTFSGSFSKTLSGTNNVSNIFSVERTAYVPTAPTYGSNASLRYSTTTNKTAGPEWPAIFAVGALSGGVLIENTGAISLNAAKVLRANTPLTIETNATLNMAAFSLTLNGNLVNNGGTLNGTSTTNGLVLTGTAAQSVGAISINGPVVVFKPLTLVSVNGNITAGGLEVNSRGTLDMGSQTHAFGSFTGTNGQWNVNSSLITFSGSISATNATLVAGSSTISFTGNASQTIPPFAFYNLGLSGTGVKNITTGTSVSVGNHWTLLSGTNLAGSANITVTGNIYGSGNLTMTSGALRIGGNWAKTGSFSAGTGTVLYYGTSAQAVGGLTYNNLQIANAGVKTIAATSTVAGVLTVFPSSQLTLGGVTLTLTSTGTPFVNNGTFNPGTSSTVLYSTGGAQNIAPATYHNLGFTGVGTKTIPAGAALTVNNNWNVSSPTNLITTGSATVTGNITGNGNITQGTGGTILISGAWTNSGTLTGTGTVNYAGITQTVANLGYHHLQASNTGVKTLATSTTVRGILTVNPVSTINIGSFTLTLSGSGTPLVNNGNFIAGASSTVHYSSVSPATIAAIDYHNLIGTGGNRTLAGSGTIGIFGTFTPGAGVYSVAGSTVDFKGSGTQVIPALTYNKLVVSNAGTKHILASAIVACQTIDIEDDAMVQINADGGGRLNVIP